MGLSAYADYGSNTKVINRNVLNTGTYMGDNVYGLPVAESVLALPGYNTKTSEGSACILQGMKTGAIKSDAKIWGVERDLKLIPFINDHAIDHDIDLDVYHGNLEDFCIPELLDRAVLDLMGVPTYQMYAYVADTVVPNMKKKALITINVCVNSIFGNAGIDTGSFQDEFLANPDTYLNPDAWDLSRPQERMWTCYDVNCDQISTGPLARSVDPERGVNRGRKFSEIHDEGCFLSFVGLHSLMKDTDFSYAGCHVYKQTPKSMKMMTMCYVRS